MKPERWREITAITDRKTHQEPATWPMDKYPDAPTLTPHGKVTVLDQDGPGVVTLFHVSDYYGPPVGDRPAAAELILRVWYDGEEIPSIEMPLMDFLGDPDMAAKSYHTVHFSRTRKSHNFRLPMPFRRHIKIEVENPTDSHPFGYMEVQWDEVDEIPEESGYLRAAFRSGTFQFPHEELVFLDIQSPGTIVGHWLQLEADHPSCADGQGICEANHEIYLDGDAEPTYESLGAEDFYGHSWGFGDLESDSYQAIVRRETTPKGGTSVTMVRARDTDKITFRKSCRILFTYRHDLGNDYFKTPQSRDAALAPFIDGVAVEAPYRSCVYYYTKD